jgi:hypothetical protein
MSNINGNTDLPQKRTLYKQNELIRNEYEFNAEFDLVSNRKNLLSIESLKLYNFLYMVFQFNRNKYNLLEDSKLIIKQTDLKKELGINNNNYTKMIETAINELLTTIAVIKNFHDKEGNLVHSYKTTLVKSVKDFTSAQDNKTKCFEFQIDNDLLNFMIKRKGTYTELDLKHYQNFKSANTIRIYEYIKSYQNAREIPELDLEGLNKLLMTKYNYLSDIEKIIDRSIKSINKETDISVSKIKNKKRKTISFVIETTTKIKLENKIKRDYSIKKTIEEKEIIEKLLNNEGIS